MYIHFKEPESLDKVLYVSTSFINATATALTQSGVTDGALHAVASLLLDIPAA